MGKVLGTLEKTFEEIVDEPSLFLDEDFMMEIFAEISEKVDPFQEYILYMFEQKLMMILPGLGSRD